MGCVDRHLSTTPQCKSIGDDFNAALVLPGGIDIKVTQPDVHGHRGTGLSAYAGCSTFDGPAPGTKDAGDKPRCGPQHGRAACGGQGQGHAESTKERHAEEELSDSSGETGLVTKTQAACGGKNHLLFMMAQLCLSQEGGTWISRDPGTTKRLLEQRGPGPVVHWTQDFHGSELSRQCEMEAKMSQHFTPC